MTRLGRSIGSCLLLLFACGFFCCYAHSQSITARELRLKDYGWQEPPLRPRHEWSGRTGQPMAIDHQGRVLIGYVVREGEGLGTRTTPSLSFRIIRITLGGNADLSLSLPTQNWHSNGIYLDAQDHILAWANEKLQVLAGGGTESKEPTWRSLAPCSMNCSISQSPSRKTLIISDFNDPHNFTYTVLDSSSGEPRIVQTCGWIAFYASRITDLFAYWPGSYGGEHFINRFSLCGKRPERMPIDEPVALPLNDQLFVINSFVHNRWVLGVATPEGHSNFRLQLPRNEAFELATSDERGDRFAASITTLRGGSRVLDISGNLVARRVVVFDSQTGQQLIAVAADTHNPIYLALSPDGRQLAILVRDLLSLAAIQ
jgi:hypothetical protein